MSGKKELHDMLRSMWGDPASILGLELCTEERWGGLAGFGKAYEAGEAEFTDLCIEDSAFVDGIDLGFAWGLLSAAANLANLDMGTMCQIAAQAIQEEE